MCLDRLCGGRGKQWRGRAAGGVSLWGAWGRRRGRVGVVVWPRRRGDAVCSCSDFCRATGDEDCDVARGRARALRLPEYAGRCRLVVGLRAVRVNRSRAGVSVEVDGLSRGSSGPGAARAPPDAPLSGERRRTRARLRPRRSLAPRAELRCALAVFGRGSGFVVQLIRPLCGTLLLQTRDLRGTGGPLSRP
jgi:hypothetical protein